MIYNGLNDLQHSNAVKYRIKNALYNKALHEWQEATTQYTVPKLDDYGLSEQDLNKKEQLALDEIENYIPFSQ